MLCMAAAQAAVANLGIFAHILPQPRSDDQPVTLCFLRPPVTLTVTPGACIHMCRSTVCRMPHQAAVTERHLPDRARRLSGVGSETKLHLERPVLEARSPGRWVAA